MHQSNRIPRVLLLLLTVALALTVAACGSSSNDNSSSGGSGGGGSSSNSGGGSSSSDQPGKGKPTFIMGDKNFAEEYILGELYAQALRAKGYTVKVKSNIGSS